MRFEIHETDKTIKYLTLYSVACMVTVVLTAIMFDHMSISGEYEHDYIVGVSVGLSLICALVVISMLNPLIKDVRIVP